MATLVEIAHLTKSYGRSRGIVDVSFAISEGEIFGFLGPNGAGKTTLIRVLLGLLRPTAGTARIAGLDCWRDSVAVKRLVGYLPGEWSFDPAMTGAAILQYLAHLRGDVDQTYLQRLVERLELDPSRRFREYSHGNRQKVGLIQAFMGRPRLLVLDEPTSGLDPLIQQVFNELLDELRAEGTTAFLSSHILSEVEHTCDRVGVIREGRIVKVAALADLKEIRAHTLTITFAEPARADWFVGLPGVLDVASSRGGCELRLTVQGDLPEVILAAGRHGAVNIATSEPTLEEIFLRFYAPERESVAAA
jgi:ABC-2 type transport system ATP-binding protein